MSPIDLKPQISGGEGAATSAEPAKFSGRRPGRRNGDVLGLAWLHGTLQAGVFRRHVSMQTWESPVPVRTLEDLEQGIDAVLDAVSFAGTEIFLILEHDEFVHQAEHAPAFSESAAKAYLRGCVQPSGDFPSRGLGISEGVLTAPLDDAGLDALLDTVAAALGEG